MAAQNVELVEHCTVDDVVRNKISARITEGVEDAFYIVDFGDIVAKYNKWKETFPRIEPFYAVKCNDDPKIIQLLASLGTGFDCASKAEIEKVLQAGVSPDRVIYANPCKQTNFLCYSRRVDVDLMTFDNEPELHKIKNHFPNARLVLRILPPSTDKVQCELGNKFGCPPTQAPQLLEIASNLGLNVVGVSFHVGSGCYDAEAFAMAVHSSKRVFDAGAQLGFDMNLLDVGGGFPGTADAKITLEEIACLMNPALDECFPPSSGVRIISEPGRFFVASAFTLTLNVIGKRAVPRDNKCLEMAGGMTLNDEPHFMYYVNDGVYGSFNCMLYDHAEVTVKVPTQSDDAPRPLFSSSLWGPTCDGLDCIKESCMLPELAVGDWVTFPNMGAYTLAAGSPFNGMPPPEVFYVAKLSCPDKSSAMAELGEKYPIKMAPEVCRLYEALGPCVAPLGDRPEPIEF